jgi:hypothetical protein
MLFPGKGFFFVLLLAAGFISLWQYGNGYLTIGRDKYACYGGRHWYKQVDKQRLIAVGPVNWYYQPWTWGCPDDHRYSSQQYDIKDGQLIPKTP